MSAKTAFGEIYFAALGVSTVVAQAHGIEIDPKPTSNRFQQRLFRRAIAR
jgi:hypothetical protein